jgi:flagellar protein FlbT
MPLKLKLAPGEKIVVNGAVMTNGQHGAVLTINNHAAIMRESHILQEEDADSPTKRLYFLVQGMLLAPPPNAAQHMAFQSGMQDLRRAIFCSEKKKSPPRCPSSGQDFDAFRAKKHR